MLRILTQPIAPASYNWESNSDFRDIYERDMDRFASQLARRLEKASEAYDHKFNLNSLCIGDTHADAIASNSSGGILRDIRCACQFVGSQNDCFGQRQRVTIPIERHLVRYAMPEWGAISQVFDFDSGMGTGHNEYQI